ncbi:unnamed protein product [Cyprideis torosa]|uniref:Uncharacterized protein n=1 Tax=Cyprideis torosa TaxID=163714 RepID=A0A7R8W5Z9_9CRUS|nr:unnamed protein product [Cyprideis torosa]CAG0885943.1 unnamed protein product [Cyprideis torosa]
MSTSVPLFSYENFVHAMSGAAGSVTAMSCCYPLDTVRSRLQVDDARQAKNTVAMIQELIREEGFLTLYRGMVPVLQSLCASNFVYFYAFHGLRRLGASPTHSALKDLVLGCAAGVVNVLVTTPLWVANTRLKMQGAHLRVAGIGSQTSSPQKYKNLLDALIKIQQQEGTGALWSSTLPSLLLVINPAVQFMIYEALKRRLGVDRNTTASWLIFLVGALSKTVSTVLTYPLQIVQSKLRDPRSEGLVQGNGIQAAPDRPDVSLDVRVLRENRSGCVRVDEGKANSSRSPSFRGDLRGHAGSVNGLSSEVAVLPVTASGSWVNMAYDFVHYFLLTFFLLVVTLVLPDSSVDDLDPDQQDFTPLAPGSSFSMDNQVLMNIALDFHSQLRQIANSELGVTRLQSILDGLPFKDIVLNFTEEADLMARRIQTKLDDVSSVLQRNRAKVQEHYKWYLLDKWDLTKSTKFFPGSLQQRCKSLPPHLLRYNAHFGVPVTFGLSCDLIPTERFSLGQNLTQIFAENARSQPRVKWQWWVSSRSNTVTVFPARSSSSADIVRLAQVARLTTRGPKPTATLILFLNGQSLNPEAYLKQKEVVRRYVAEQTDRDFVLFLPLGESEGDVDRSPGGLDGGRGGCSDGGRTWIRMDEDGKRELLQRMDALPILQVSLHMPSALLYSVGLFATVSPDEDFERRILGFTAAVSVDSQGQEGLQAALQRAKAVASTKLIDLYSWTTIHGTSGHSATYSMDDVLDPAQELFPDETNGASQNYSSVLSQSNPILSLPTWDATGKGLVVTLSLPCSHAHSLPPSAEEGTLDVFGVVALDLALEDLLEDVAHFSASHGIVRGTYAFLLHQTATCPLPLLPGDRLLPFRRIVRAPLLSRPQGQTEWGQRLYSWSRVKGFPLVVCVVFVAERSLLSSGKVLAQKQLDLMPTDLVFHDSSLLPPNKRDRQFRPRHYRYLNDMTSLIANPGLKPNIKAQVNAFARIIPSWKANLDASPRSDFVIRRYVATPSGVMISYPAQRMSPSFDPTRREWFRKGAAQPGKIIVLPLRLDEGGAGHVVTVSHALYEAKPNSLHAPEDEVVAVIAADFTGFPLVVCVVFVAERSLLSSGKVLAQKQLDLMPTDLVFHDSSLLPPNKRDRQCRHFRQISSILSGSVYLSPACFLHPSKSSPAWSANPSSKAGSVMAYLNDMTSLIANPGLKPNIKAQVNAFARIIPSWKANLDASPRSDFVIRRYVATPSGVMISYPAQRMSPSFDPTRREWFRKGAAQPGKIIVLPLRLLRVEL